MSRTEASDLLMGERECGTFLIRDSLSIQGDYVLCVRYVISINFQYIIMDGKSLKRLKIYTIIQINICFGIMIFFYIRLHIHLIV